MTVRAQCHGFKHVAETTGGTRLVSELARLFLHGKKRWAVHMGSAEGAGRGLFAT